MSLLLEKTNITRRDTASFALLWGGANQYVVAGSLMRMGFHVFMNKHPARTFDMIIPAFEDFANEKDKAILLHAQVRTVRKSMRFIGGTRAGSDRVYKPGVKVYKYSTKHNDMIIGVDPATLDLYFVPTRFIDKWGNSVSKSKLAPLKNNVGILLNWNDSFLDKLRGSLS